MEKNPYLSIMIQSLKKKSAVLDAVIELNIRQKEELENPGLDPDDFDACVEEKAKQIEQLELLDAGFQEVYAAQHAVHAVCRSPTERPLRQDTKAVLSHTSPFNPFR